MLRLLCIGLLTFLYSLSLSAQVDAFDRSVIKDERVLIDCWIYKTKTYKVDKALNLKEPNSFNALISSYALSESVVESSEFQLTKYFENKDNPIKIEARSRVDMGGMKFVSAYSAYYYFESEEFILVEQSYYFTETDIIESEKGWMLFDANTGELKAMVLNGQEKDLDNMSAQNQKVAEMTYKGALLFRDLK